MNKAYKFRIYPSKEQIELIEKTFGCTRFVYNYFLDQRIETYKTEGKSTTYTKQQNQLPELKKELSWLNEVDSTSLQMSLRNLDRAFKNFFRDKSIGFPKFKNKKNPKKSYTINYVNNNIQIKKNSIKLPKLKNVKAKVHRFVEGRIINATISKSPTNKYFVSIITELDIEPKDETNKSIGIDLGIKDFAILSNGEKINNPTYLKKTLDKLAKEQRKLSKKQKFSNNWYKQKQKVAKLHEKVKHQRQDFLHKLSKRIVDENQIIILEDLSIKNMMKNKKLSKDIADVSWYKFYSYLDYKSKWYRRTIHKIDKWFPSSKTCSYCGYIMKDMPLNIRKWDCPNCKTKNIDRDINASINILKQGLKELGIQTVA
ncbi:IS200/IS605 family element RNA-guided endonuclease TnpB [Schnuerera sp.]|uniref:IS200/IS605 family element RNA-guided endonuclease TnpB n=1 Tax=Schnuerera sp. TaxID=2794844 RepID=UPI002BDC033F|nr:IS200/IS605 family element RNA-guided endonuclease TnpB [Schnuerera sp.]HSH37123.1 IS200/IS605 family element RNA-guided endonuclease TnpB [Schnuerera sp.]